MFPYYDSISHMSDNLIQEAASYHALAEIFQGEHKTLKREWDAHGSWEKARKKNGISIEKALRSYEMLSKIGVSLVLRDDQKIPSALREIPWPPFALYVKGAPLQVEETCIAVVGTRKATKEGKQ